MDLATLPFVPCNHRSPRPHNELIVIHTNEGPEGPTSAEGLASYLHQPNVDPGYNVVVDENSAVKTAGDSEMMWGAGGVNSRAWHLCLTGYAAQSGAQWDDPSSHAELINAASLVRQAANLLGIPKVRIHDTRTGGPRGICGHADVSAYHPESMGHTDPGPNFPWDRFMALVAGDIPTPTPDPPPPPPEEDEVSGTFYYAIDKYTHRMWVSEVAFGSTRVGDLMHLFGPPSAAFPQGAIENMTKKYGGTLGPQVPDSADFIVRPNTFGSIIDGTTIDKTGAIVTWTFSPDKGWRCVPYFPVP